MSDQSKSIVCRVAIHHIQADIITGLQKGKISLQNDSLRVIAQKVGAKNNLRLAWRSKNF